MRPLVILGTALGLCGLSAAAPRVPCLAGRHDEHCRATTVYTTTTASEEHCRLTTIYTTTTASEDNGIHITGTNTKSYETVTITVPGPVVTGTTTVYVPPTSSQNENLNSDTNHTIGPCTDEKISPTNSTVTITRTNTGFQTITVTVTDIAPTTVVYHDYLINTTTVVVPETVWLQGAPTVLSPATTVQPTSDTSVVAVIISVPVIPMKSRLQVMGTESTSTYASSESVNALPPSASITGIAATYADVHATPSGFTSSFPAYNQSVVLPRQTSPVFGGFGSDSTFTKSIKADLTSSVSTYSSQVTPSIGIFGDVNSTNSELPSSSSSTYPTRFTVIRPTRITETGLTSSRRKKTTSTTYETTYDSYTYSSTSSSTSDSTVLSGFTLAEPTLTTLNPAIFTSCIDFSSSSSSCITLISSTAEPVSIITNSPKSSSTTSSDTSIPTATSSAGCGEQGIFSLNFDDLPPLPENLTDVPPVPIFSPYHHFWFSEGFVLVPPPRGPYLPSSKPLLVEFLTQSNINATRNDNNSAPGAYGATGEIGNGPNVSWGCYSFDAVAASVGCDSLGESCDWQFTGVTYDATGEAYSEVTTSRVSTPGCPEGADCALTNVVFLESFANIQSLRINVTVAGVPKIWWMDDLKLDWADNSCEAGLCRASHR